MMERSSVASWLRHDGGEDEEQTGPFRSGIGFHEDVHPTVMAQP